jgi:hypothetical protein
MARTLQLKRTDAGDEMPRRKTPWEKPDPKPPSKRRTLTPAQKAAAAARAKRAGRPYPNLVDNMAVARTRNRK